MLATLQMLYVFKLIKLLPFLHVFEPIREALHDRVVDKLIRSGVDKLNKSFERLVKKRRKKLAAMSKSERSDSKKRIDALDLSADRLGINVQEVDNNVIIFQKEVDKVLDEADYAEHSFFFESNATVHVNAADRKRSRKSSKKDWDPHQHASYKRMSSINKQHASSSGNKRTKTNESDNRSNHNSSTHQSERMATNSQSEIDFNDNPADFDVSSDVEIPSSDTDFGAAKSHSIDNDVIGETDETDDNPS